MVFLSIKSLPNLLFGVLCLPGDQSHPFAQPTINPLACCICWARLLGRAVFPPWNKGPNSGSYKPRDISLFLSLTLGMTRFRSIKGPTYQMKKIFSTAKEIINKMKSNILNGRRYLQIICLIKD